MLKNKVALVTGAGRGIGRAIAIALAKEGAEVIVNYNGSEERAKEVKQTIEENGGKASIYKCNVSDFEACEAMIKDVVKEYGHLDILVNNAGITKDGLIMKMKEEDFDAVLNANLKGTFNTIRHSSSPDAETEKRKDHQHFFCFRNPWKCRTGELCSIQSGSHRSDQRQWQESLAAAASQ